MVTDEKKKLEIDFISVVLQSEELFNEEKNNG